MVSPLSGLNLQGAPDQTLSSVLSGRQAYQQSQLNQQAMQQNQQQISKADYDQAVQRLGVINRLATKAKSLTGDQRYAFVQSINPEMLKSVGIDPAQISTVQLDDNSLDALIAQTSAALPEAGKFRKESVSTNQGLQVFDPSTGTYVAAMGADKKPLTAAAYDPSLAGQIAGARQTAQNVSDLGYKPEITKATEQAKAGVELATKPEITKAVNEADIESKSTGQAKIDLPKVEDAASNLKDMIDGVLTHKGRAYATGGYSYLPVVRGTPQADFVNRMDQINGSAFLEAFSTLRGGGQITEVEGKKATQAINRMNVSTSDKEFNDAASQLKTIIDQGLARARDKAKPSSSTPSRRSSDKMQGGSGQGGTTTGITGKTTSWNNLP